MNDLELHYYLDDGRHSMDAFVKNRAEHELLKLISEVSTLLEIDLSVEIEAMEQGGIKEIIKFFTKNKNKAYLGVLIFFSSILGNVITDVASDVIKTDKELDSLTKEEKRLNIRKLKQELENDKSKDTTVIIHQITNTINSDFKVKVFKSRFFTQICKEKHIYEFSLTELHNDPTLSNVAHTIKREDFQKQILEDENTPIIIIENANVEIVAPVLTRSEMKWRGNYNGKTMTFELKDNEFKNAVLNKQFSFSTGTSIRCSLSYKEGVNENGDFCLKEIVVYNVLEVYESTTTLVTDKYKRLKALTNQTKLPF